MSRASGHVRRGLPLARSDRTGRVWRPLRVPLTDTHPSTPKHPADLANRCFAVEGYGGLIGTGASLSVAVAGSLVLYRLAGLI